MTTTMQPGKARRGRGPLVVVVTLVVVLVVVGVLWWALGRTPDGDAPLPDPLGLLEEAATNIRSVETFRMSVGHAGVLYFIETLLGQMSFREAVAQYVAPDIMQATARVRFAGLTQEILVFSKGDVQWYRLTGSPWIEAPFALGFNPATLVASDAGFQAALTALKDIEMVGRTRLEDGTPVFHMRGSADGPAVTELLVGLIQAPGDVLVDVYVHTETRFPARLVIVQPETVSENDPVPTTWTVDIYGLNDAPTLDIPPNSGVTLEAR